MEILTRSGKLRPAFALPPPCPAAPPVRSVLDFRPWLAACLLALLLLGGAQAQAAGRIAEVAVLVDSAGSETIDTVSAPAAAGRFQPLRGTSLSAGYSMEVRWLRITVDTTAGGEQWLEVQPPYLDDLRLYEALPGGGYGERHAGDRQPFAAREVAYRGFVFRLHPPEAGRQIHYLRLQTTSTSLVALELWQPDEFQLAKRSEYGALGIYYGLLFAVLLLNLLQWATVRDRLTGHYLLYLAVTGLFFYGSNGLAAEYFLPGQPAVTDAWVSAGGPLVIASGAPFFRRLLLVDRSRPVLNWLFHGLCLLPLLVIPAVFTGHYTQLAGKLLWYVTAMSLLCTWLAARMWRRGQVGGVLVFLAYCAGMFGVFAATLTMLGVLPGNLWIVYGNQMGIMCSVLVMHLAVAARARAIDEERREALQRVALTQRELESERHARQEQGKFLAMLSHELKTPLAMIDGAVQSLAHLLGGAPPDVARRHDRIRRAVRRINGLVEQFLTHDRVDDDRLAPRREAVDLNALVERIAAEYGAADGRVQLRNGALPPVQCDPALLRVALVNLIDNAFKYGPPGSPVVIATGLSGAGATAAIEVMDRGPGIAEPLREEVFERYVRGTDLGDIPGAGLGLYLVRRIANVHGGSAAVETRPGGGALFRICLPLHPTLENA